jgi:hypothetical protein
MADFMSISLLTHTPPQGAAADELRTIGKQVVEVPQASRKALPGQIADRVKKRWAQTDFHLRQRDSRIPRWRVTKQ